jgi:hypothetical protein
MSVSLETALESLHRDLSELQRALSELQPFIADVRGTVALVDDLDNVVTELTSGVEEAAASAGRAARASQPDGALDIVRSALGQTHDVLNRITVSYIGLFVPEVPEDDSIMATLLMMGDERGDQWLDWNRVVTTSIERCAMPLQKAAESLLDCWSELAERLARHSVSVQATNIGQQISVRDDQLEAANRAS